VCSEVGHFARDCPKRNIEVMQVVRKSEAQILSVTNVMERATLRGIARESE
jgi:hypothetical protein